MFQPTQRLKHIIDELMTNDIPDFPDWVEKIKNHDYSEIFQKLEEWKPFLKEEVYTSYFDLISHHTFVCRKMTRTTNLLNADSFFFYKLLRYPFDGRMMIVTERELLFRIQVRSCFFVFKICQKGIIPDIFPYGPSFSINRILNGQNFDRHFHGDFSQFKPDFYLRLAIRKTSDYSKDIINSSSSFNINPSYEELLKPLDIGTYIIKKGIFSDDLMKEAEVFLAHLANYQFLIQIGILSKGTSFQQYNAFLEKYPNLTPLWERPVQENIEEEFELIDNESSRDEAEIEILATMANDDLRFPDLITGSARIHTNSVFEIDDREDNDL